jgi:predicted alpha-1,2-mannosidase
MKIRKLSNQYFTLLKNIIKIKGIQIASVILLILFVTSCNPKEKSKNGLSYVDPRIGGVGLLLQPTRPTVQVPNQMIRMYPVRKDYIDDQIRYFPLTIISHRLGELFGLMPFTGSLKSGAPLSAWDKEVEKSKPYYFSTWLEDYSVTVEFSPGKKTGYFRFTFPDKTVKNIFLRNVNKGIWNITETNAVSAEESFNGMKAYVYGEFNKKATLNGSTTGRAGGSYLSWNESSANVIDFKYAVSFISTEHAQKSLSEEIPGWSLDKVKESAKLAWDNVLNQIQVKGGSDIHKRTFYTALYRCYERMMNITEAGEYYSNYDTLVHKTERNFYVDDWIWDTYLALHPLRTILDPAKESDMVQSYVDMYSQSGWLPTFPVLWGDNPCMNGFHSAITILDVYRKGIRNFDIDKAYEGMKKNALEATMLPWRNGPACVLDSFYWKNGFYPALPPGDKETVALVHPFEKRQSVAITLGHSYDDWALAQMAKELGKSEDYDYFMKRSNNYKNLYWSEKGFFMPKDSKGQWIDIDPKFDGGMGGRDYYDENNGWTYLWQVQHDLPGLINLMGGKQNFETRLDQMFRESLGRSKYELYAKFPDFTGIVGQFSMGNEPSFHIPYLYNLTGSPWKTQKRIRMLLDTWYPDNIFGIPGDEDGGGMSAFVVFSSMGFYPLVPGLPIYTIGSPLFEEVRINLPNGKIFTVLAPGGTETNKYIQKAWLNDRPLDVPWFTHNDLINGGVLKLEMGPYPNISWGRGEFNIQ